MGICIHDGYIDVGHWFRALIDDLALFTRILYGNQALGVWELV